MIWLRGREGQRVTLAQEEGPVGGLLVLRWSDGENRFRPDTLVEFELCLDVAER